MKSATNIKPVYPRHMAIKLELNGRNLTNMPIVPKITMDRVSENKGVFLLFVICQLSNSPKSFFFICSCFSVVADVFFVNDISRMSPSLKLSVYCCSHYFPPSDM